MTSANLSLIDKMRTKKKYINRTLWTSLVAFPVMAAFYILGVVMMVSRSINYAAVYKQSDVVLHQEKLKAVTGVMGFESPDFLLVAVIAIVFAFQGFSYVFSQSKLDFYLSQPTTRRQRVVSNYGNAIFSYLFIYIFSASVALLIAACMGAVNGVVLVSVLLQGLRNFVFFIAIYNIAVLSVLLTGSLPIAMMLCAFLSFFTVIFAWFISVFKSIFFVTKSYQEKFDVYLSPYFDRLSVLRLKGFRSSFSSDYNQGMNTVCSWISSTMRKEVDILLVAVITVILVDVCSRYRRAEWAGKSIVLRPFRWAVKVMVCIFAGLFAGTVVHVIYESVWNNKIYVLMCVIMLLAAIAAGMICEIVFDSNIKSAFKGKCQTIMACALVMLIFVIFKGDLLGYDSYVPNASKVASCSFVDDSYVSYSGPEIGARVTEVGDTEAFLEMAQIGMAYKREQKKESKIYRGGYDADIMYTLKSGKKVYRSICLPYEVSEDVMNRVLSDEKYINELTENLVHEDLWNDFYSEENREFTYRTATDHKDCKDLDLKELKNALSKDLKDACSFTYFNNRLPVGTLECTAQGENYLRFEIPVYDSYENTFKFLKEHDIYCDSEPDFSGVNSLTVVNYYPGYNIEELEAQGEDLPNVDSYEEEYTDPDKIQEILKGVVATDYYNMWYNYDKLDGQYNVIVKGMGDFRGDISGKYFSFKKGSIPDFVIADTNK